MPALGAPTAKRLRYDDNLGLKIKLKAHKSLEYMSFDSGEETDLNYSGGCLALLGWRSGPWGMQVRYDMRWNTLFTRRYFNEGSEWDDWVRLATCMPPEVHDLPLYNGYTNLGCKYFRTQENVVSFAGGIERMSGFHQDEAFAVLPEGFRPDHAIVVPALLYPSFTPASIIIKSNGEICETITSSDKSLYMQATFVAG